MTGSDRAWIPTLLDFWLIEVGEEGWWSHDPALDQACLARFGALWAEKRDLPAADFLGSADEALAAIILFDQLPRNMFRATAQAFTTDALAQEIAHGALDSGYDKAVIGASRRTLYMPFQHSENAADQALSVSLFAQTGDERALDFALKHQAVVDKFGRFPHRNAALGRADRPGEAEAIAEGSNW